MTIIVPVQSVVGGKTTSFILLRWLTDPLVNLSLPSLLLFRNQRDAVGKVRDFTCPFQDSLKVIDIIANDHAFIAWALSFLPTVDRLLFGFLTLDLVVAPSIHSWIPLCVAILRHAHIAELLELLLHRNCSSSLCIQAICGHWLLKHLLAYFISRLHEVLSLLATELWVSELLTVRTILTKLMVYSVLSICI